MLARRLQRTILPNLRLATNFSFSQLEETSGGSKNNQSSPTVSQSKNDCWNPSISFGSNNHSYQSQTPNCHFSHGIHNNLRVGGSNSQGSSHSWPPSNAAHIGYRVLEKLDGKEIPVEFKEVFAVVQVGSHQFKVTPGDIIYVEKLNHADVNEKLALEKVLLLGNKSNSIIGRPIIPEASVLAAVEEHALDEKVIIFKKRRRKNYRRHNGHRQELTRLRILDIVGLGENLENSVEQPMTA